MKNLILLAIISVALIQCSSDPCENTTCEYNMPCVDGDCECELGLSGERCEIADRDIFIGLWEGSIQCTPDNVQQPFVMDIQANKDDWHVVDIYLNGSEQAIFGTVNMDEILAANINVNTGMANLTKASFKCFFFDSNTLIFDLDSNDDLITGPIFCNATLFR